MSAWDDFKTHVESFVEEAFSTAKPLAEDLLAKTSETLRNGADVVDEYTAELFGATTDPWQEFWFDPGDGKDAPF